MTSSAQSKQLGTQHTNSIAIGTLSDVELSELFAASEEVSFWQEVLSKTSDTPITDLLRGVETLDISAVYPEDTVEDHETGCQYYFHAHADRDSEYGHFHTYVMQQGLPASVRATNPAVTGEHGDAHRTHCHLVAIGLDDHGAPQSIFTTNYWSTQDAEYSVSDLTKILDTFDIGHAVPSYPVNRWITGVLKLFRYEIIDLFRQREDRFSTIRSEKQAENPARDERIEVPSYMEISIPQQISAVQAEYLRRGLG